MEPIDDILGRLKRMECPAGEVADRVRTMLAEYEAVAETEIAVFRERSLDRDGTQGYVARFPRNQNGLGLAVLTESGMDDYVAKVVDAYLL
ncbi:hypothetical protein [Propionispora vibrioides]|uniref:Uncharacterized protein n=1 Tax=Propionispora vibrioides TaxID=112903 RepID=A0A1H8R9R6_9FIRM|nr:hypothetical protein [Propionispora vibrioides]SEO62878.1 hypothetical protein SAMN04490178_103205 [Propionispora vibrioides]